MSFSVSGLCLKTSARVVRRWRSTALSTIPHPPSLRQAQGRLWPGRGWITGIRGTPTCPRHRGFAPFDRLRAGSLHTRRTEWTGARGRGFGARPRFGQRARSFAEPILSDIEGLRTTVWGQTEAASHSRELSSGAGARSAGAQSDAAYAGQDGRSSGRAQPCTYVRSTRRSQTASEGAQSGAAAPGRTAAAARARFSPEPERSVGAQFRSVLFSRR